MQRISDVKATTTTTNLTNTNDTTNDTILVDDVTAKPNLYSLSYDS